MARDGPITSSVPLQALLFFHGWFAVLFFTVTLALMIYKGAAAPATAQSAT